MIGREIHIDDRLKERLLSTTPFENWKHLSNPGVYELEIGLIRDKIIRSWKEEKEKFI